MSSYKDILYNGAVISQIEKSVGSILDYGVDFSKRLKSNEVITNKGIDVSSSSISVGTRNLTGNILWAMVSGGIIGQNYLLTHWIETNDGVVDRKREKTIMISVKQY